MHYRWGQTASKRRKVATLNSAHEVKKARQFWRLEQEQDNLQRFFWMFWNLLKEIILKNNNQINSTVTTRTWVLSTEWTRTWANAVLLSKWKNNGGLRLLEWSMSFFRNRMNKDEGNEMQCKCDYFWSIQRKADHPQVV